MCQMGLESGVLQHTARLRPRKVAVILATACGQTLFTEVISNQKVPEPAQLHRAPLEVDL